MTDTNVVKQLEGLLAPIKKDLGGVKKDLGEINKKLVTIDVRLNGIDKRLDGVDVKLNQHTGALVNIEDTIKVYGDMYQVNNDNARKLEKRIGVLENNEGIVPPREYRLVDL